MREDKRVWRPKRLSVRAAYFSLLKMIDLSTIGVDRDYRTRAVCQIMDYGLTDIGGLQKSTRYSPCATRNVATLIVVEIVKHTVH